MTNRRSDQIRQRLAQEAARLMVADSLDDYQRAKEKAAQRLGIREKHCFPQNEEIDQAAAEYIRLFASDSQAQHLTRLRKTGLAAMEFFGAFDTYLSGAAASGTVGPHTSLLLELYADTPELVLQRLRDASIPFEEKDFLAPATPQGPARAYPKISFVADEIPVELLILPTALRHQKLGGSERLTQKQLRMALQASETGNAGR